MNWEDVPEIDRVELIHDLAAMRPIENTGAPRSLIARRAAAINAAIDRLDVAPAYDRTPDWTRSVLDTAAALHGSVTGSGDPIDEDEVAKWLDARVSPDGWRPSATGREATYDEAVRHLARAAVAEARVKER